MITIETRRKMSESALNRKNKPMHDPDIVKKKMATFYRNLTEGTRRKWSRSTKKQWKDPAFRAKMQKSLRRRFKVDPHINDESVAKANRISRLLPSRRKRSKSKERQEANSKQLPKLGKEIKIRHPEEDRENDHCGVVVEDNGC